MQPWCQGMHIKVMPTPLQMAATILPCSPHLDPTVPGRGREQGWGDQAGWHLGAREWATENPPWGTERQHEAEWRWAETLCPWNILYFLTGPDLWNIVSKITLLRISRWRLQNIKLPKQDSFGGKVLVVRSWKQPWEYENPVAMAWNGLASLVAQTVKNSPTMQETWVRSLGREDPLEWARKPIPVFWPGESHDQRSLAGYSPWGHKESDTTEQLTLSFFHSLRNAKVPIPLPTPKPSDSLRPPSRWLPWSHWKSGSSPLLSLVLSSTLQPPVLLQWLWLPPCPDRQGGFASCICRLLCSRRCGLALCVSLIPCIAESGKSLLALLRLYNYLSSTLNVKGVKWIITLGLKWVNETVPGKPGHKVIPSATE